MTGDQKTKMKGELHDNPAMGHEKKGYQKVKLSSLKKHAFNGKQHSY